MATPIATCSLVNKLLLSSRTHYDLQRAYKIRSKSGVQHAKNIHLYRKVEMRSCLSRRVLQALCWTTNDTMHYQQIMLHVRKRTRVSYDVNAHVLYLPRTLRAVCYPLGGRPSHASVRRRIVCQHGCPRPRSLRGDAETSGRPHAVVSLPPLKEEDETRRNASRSCRCCCYCLSGHQRYHRRHWWCWCRFCCW